MASSGVESMRTVFSWAGAQPRGRGTPISFEDTDPVVRRAALRTAPCFPWCTTRRPGRAPIAGRFTSPPKLRSDYAAYLAALVERYGPDGTFWAENPDLPKLAVREWQIWNEPHLPAYWDAPENGPYGYARNYPLLLRASYNIVKTLDPGAKVVLAGITQKAWEEIELLYQHGVKNYFDVAALQIFPQTVKRALQGHRAVPRRAAPAQGRAQADLPDRDHLARLEGADRRIKYQRQETPQGMATKLSQMYRAMVLRRRALGVGKVFWYTWSSPYGRGGSIFNYAGLLRYDDRGFEPQPALGAYQRSARTYQGCQKTVTGVCQ